MRAAAVVAVLTLVAAVPAQAAQRLSWRQRHHLVRYQGVDRVDWSVKENRLTIKAAFHHYGLGHATALCVARRESGFNNEAYNPSGASGLFQHIRRYWPGRVAAYNRHAFPKWKVSNTSPFNARANALVTAWMVRHGGWGPWGGGC